MARNLPEILSELNDIADTLDHCDYVVEASDLRLLLERLGVLHSSPSPSLSED